MTFSILALFVASLVAAHAPDDWAVFNHRSFGVTDVVSGDRILIQTGTGKIEPVKLLGISPIDSSAAKWMKEQIAGQRVTLLLQSPQTRNADGSLSAFVFFDNKNLSVELAKAGLAYADRREKTEMDSLIDTAEADARKKKRGAWATLSFEQMPAWRQAWLKSLPQWR
jgi:endonuclease YncB( thermonuclease family)